MVYSSLLSASGSPPLWSLGRGFEVMSRSYPRSVVLNLLKLWLFDTVVPGDPQPWNSFVVTS